MVAGGIFIFFAVSLIIFTISAHRNYTAYARPGQLVISIVAPFQEVVTHSIRFVNDIWEHYFFLVSVSKENAQLKKALSKAIEKENHYTEIELSNLRLRNLLDFRKTMINRVTPAEVIGKDPSPWFKSVIIDKGSVDGLKKGLPVVIPEGIVGMVTDVAYHYSKVLLIIDQNSAVDALVQRTRARGIIKGKSSTRCVFKYVLRKHDVKIGDTVVSSGLDGVFPKGLRIGSVLSVIRKNSGIFQEVTVSPYVDFEKLEEVLVVLNHPSHEFVRGH